MSNQNVVTAVVSSSPSIGIPPENERAPYAILKKISDIYPEVEIIPEGSILKFPTKIQKKVEQSVNELCYFLRITGRYEEKKKERDNGGFAYTPECLRVDGG